MSTHLYVNSVQEDYCKVCGLSRGAARHELADIQVVLAAALTPDNENLTQGFTAAAVRDLAQVALSHTGTVDAQDVLLNQFREKLRMAIASSWTVSLADLQEWLQELGQ